MYTVSTAAMYTVSTAAMYTVSTAAMYTVSTAAMYTVSTEGHKTKSGEVTWDSRKRHFYGRQLAVYTVPSVRKRLCLWPWCGGKREGFALVGRQQDV